MFFETICWRNGLFERMDFHQRRFDTTRAVHYPAAPPICLQTCLPQPPAELHTNQVRCRVEYGAEILQIQFFEYQLATHTRVKLAAWPAEQDYSFKYQNRDFFQKQLAASEGADDVIFLKNGFLTDATYANVALHDGHQWYTPSTYLLNGTKRQYLLEHKQITEKVITIEDLPNYQKIAFINAMRDFGHLYNFTLEGQYLHLIPAAF